MIVTQWPDDQSIRNCIDWNVEEARRANRDARNRELRVPATAVRYDGVDRVQLTRDEYREQRKLDAQRYERNIRNLQEKLGDPFYGAGQG